ncbi:MAG: hypothetical protein EOQ40_15045 [Mesorhizobium sp.]|uniref:hypothetical protein n=1 Tax=Mesorhizobium sp. TaxID=1871066 RepID=UPI000FE96B1A|nr:hypothetical protein [Mesorhizobium sp.]RWB20381.1 MAG: hypothetical protein EOQ40_15045 [Mesorhizobium sp.]
MVALANALKDENAALEKRVEELEKLMPKWNKSADDLVELQKALSEPSQVRDVEVRFKQPGKCQAGEVMVGWMITGTPDLETVHGRIECAKVFGARP